MRLALVVAAFPRLSETFIVNKFLGLLERGWDVYVVCGRLSAGEWRHFPQLADAKVRRRVLAGPIARPRWRALVSTCAAVVRAFATQPRGSARYLRVGWRRWRCGVLRRLALDAPVLRLRPALVHFEFGALAVGRMHLRDLLPCRITVSFRGYDLNFVGLEVPGFYDQVWQQADGLHFLGEDLWRRAQRRGCPSDKPHVLIPPAVRVEEYAVLRREEPSAEAGRPRPLRILSVARLEWKKGYEYALAALELLKQRGIEFEYRAVGAGEYLEAIAFARHQLGLEEEVQLLGALPPAEVKRQLAWADVFLHAAVSEGFCNAVLEAQAAGLPVVCSDAGGLAENVEDGVTGFVVPRRDPRAMAERLAELAEKPALRQELADAGRQRVTAMFSFTRQLDALSEWYASALAPDASGTGRRPRAGRVGDQQYL